MMRLTSWIVGSLASVTVCVAAAHAETRLALVIGNSEYTGGMPPLPNAANDAMTMIDALKDSKFEIFETGFHNLPQSDMTTAIERFAQKAGGEDVALLYYAGHAISLDGVSYLIPSDMDVSKIREGNSASYAQTVLADRSTPLSLVLNAMGDAHTKIIIVDACRDNPITEAINSGQIIGVNSRFQHDPFAPSPGIAIIYTTGENLKVLDELNPGDNNGPFVTSFKHFYKTPGLNLYGIIAKINEDVNKRMRQDQKEQYAQLVAQPRGTAFSFVPPEDVDMVNIRSKLDELRKLVGSGEGSSPPQPDPRPLAPQKAAVPDTLLADQAGEVATKERDAGRGDESNQNRVAAQRHYAEARRQYAIAVATGDPVDETNYATMLIEGMGGPIEERKAIELLTDAAQKGQVEARFALGELAFKRGDYDQARRWLSMVVDCRHIDYTNRQEKVRAAYYLGIMLVAQPDGVRQGTFCLNRAGVAGDPDANQWLDKHRSG